MTKLIRQLLTILFIGTILFLSSCDKEQTPVIPKNNIPAIDSLKASKTRVRVESEIEIIAFAHDKDNDSLQYNWSSKRGSFRRQLSNSIIWKAPKTSGADTITVTISDGKVSVNKTVSIFVGTPPNSPLLIDPYFEQNCVELKAKLTWQHVNGSLSYNLQVSKDISFKNILIEKKLKSANFFINNLELDTKYFWRVNSINEFGPSSWSKIFSFRTVSFPLTPLLVSPVDSAKNVEPNATVCWNKISNATQYKLQIAKNADFSNIVVDVSNVIDTIYQVSFLEHFANYFWRVKAINNCGESDWSNANEFQILGTKPNTTKLLYPQNNSYNNPLIIDLIWNKELHSSYYFLEVSEDSLFSEKIVSINKLETTKYELTNLKYFTKYFWRVSSSNEYGNGMWSSTYSFTTKIASPELTGTDIIENGRPLSPELIWNEVNGAESYSLQVAVDSSFSNIVFSDTSITLPKHRISGLLDYTNYYWRIAANNKLGNSNWSAVQTFKTTGYYYQGLPYGNQSIYNPAYVILTGGFGMIQFEAKRDIKNFPYNIAFKNIWNNLKNPFTPINNYGWWNFIQDQIFPLSLNKKNAQFWPNYTLHLIGGGMAYAQTREWFKYYKYPYPSWLSAFTVMTYHLINEVVENGERIGEDVDPIADFYLFDIGGILLFSSENVKRFFAEELNLSDWSQQPSISLKNGELHNNDQFFSVKWKFPFSDSWHAFYYFGTNGVGGLSYKFRNGSAISVGAGLAASDLIVLDEKTNKKTLGLVGNFAAFYDLNNSLLASLAVTIKTDYMVNVNIYPGLVKLWGFSPGLWAAYSQNGNYIFGITATWLPLGFAYSTK